MPRAIDARRAGLVAGIAITFTSLVGLLVPSLAQTDGSVPKEEPAKAEREAYFTAPSNGAVPATLTNEFPPGIVCILIPQVCGQTTQPVAGPVSGAVGPAATTPLPDHTGPQPVEPNTLPVGMLGGKPRYTSYLKFVLPSSIPQGSLVDRFDLVVTQTDVSYALESPAFRQAVLAGLVTYQNRSPAEFTAFIANVANQTTPLAARAPTGVELCAVTGPWKAGASQNSATQPPRDCIFGANGVYNPVAKTWTFDLSLLAQAWLDGTTPNEGVYLGPVGADNLAFGDPDTSTNWQVSLAGSKAPTPPKVRYSFTAGFGDEEAFELGESEALPDETVSDFGGTGESFDAFAAPEEGTFDASLLAGDAPQEEAATPSAPLRGQLVGQSRPRTPWWLWLLLPLGLGVAYAFGRSAEQVPPAGARHGGALTRLMATAGGGDRSRPLT